MKQLLVFSMIFIIILSSCSKKDVHLIQPPPTEDTTELLAKKLNSRYLQGDKEYMVYEFYDGAHDRWNDLPDYMRDDTFIFYEGMNERYDNSIMNPWDSTDIVLTTYDVFTKDKHTWMSWKNILTAEPVTYKVESVNDERCSILLSYIEIDGTLTYVKLAKLL